MRVLDEIVVKQQSGTNARLQLLYGDLTALPKSQAVDILVSSAFPNDYTALPGSLFHAFEQKGFSIAKLAANKQHDYRSTLSCWLSNPLSKEDEDRFHFKQLLCLEPENSSTDPVEVVGNIFRCLNSFAFDDDHNSIAMPIVASGKQRVPVPKILPALVDAALFWLQQGLPLESIKIVIHKVDHLGTALQIFKEKKETALAGPPVSSVAKPAKNTAGDPASRPRNSISAGPPKAANVVVPPAKEPEKPPPVDVFISYAHKQQDVVMQFVKALKNVRPGLNIFYDRESIQGGQWLRMISDAIANSKKVLVFISPDYNKSPVCWDEFQCAKVIEYNQDKRLIQTIYLMNDDHIPPIMAVNSWVDCREGDLEKLTAWCSDFDIG